ncbi:adenosylcobinamide-GDP ribazoletransferase [Paenibacillus hamazuiensis]|uniref:adenosylcobinamide-GDP ribazoletransferase n=1 Tax=Paenibacillus hamazuiensis TaxID=2936508 RepID=UPI00200BABB8|nr:adenosylcobinamide-GDP ribazoletransferase [Paenibacillus hamazuiensis]
MKRQIVSAFQALTVALQFLTRIPLPVSVPYDGRTVSRSVAFYPLVGIVIGALLVLTARLLPAAPALLNAALLLVLWIALTGGLHLDGWMDAADGLLSHRSRERMLEIMKDSRVGAMGVIAAVLLLLIKWICLYELLAYAASHPGFAARTLPAVLLAVPAISRWCMAAAIVRRPYIGGPNGLGALLADARGRTMLLAVGAVWCAAAAFLAPWPLWGAVAAGQLAAGFAFARYVMRRLGGWTGDTYGALNEAVEAAGLVAAVYAAAEWGG